MQIVLQTINRAIVWLVRWFNALWPLAWPKGVLTGWTVGRVRSGSGPRLCKHVQRRFHMQLDLSGRSGRLMLLNYYRPAVLAVLRERLGAGDEYVECGAGAGYFALAASHWVGTKGRVYVFEPKPSAATMLEENARLNGSPAADIIRLRPNAAWDGPQTAKLYSYVNPGVLTASLGRREDLILIDECPVETVRLDDVVDPPVRLIRLDVAGAELPALRGAETVVTTGKPDVIVTLDPKATEPFGYQPIDIVNWLRRRRGEAELFLLTDEKRVAVSWEELRTLLKNELGGRRDLWLTSSARSEERGKLRTQAGPQPQPTRKAETAEPKVSATELLTRRTDESD
jgi:FkbM family methyltransferase